MRISINDVPGLMTPLLNLPTTQPRQRRKSCGRDIAKANELSVGIAVAKYGHLRVAEIARAVWPMANWPEQMAQRTCRRMVQAGYLLTRRNALGGNSYVLTRTGATWLSLHGNDARHTLELSSVGGATFIHRTLATRYLIERSVNGTSVASEYEISNNRLPFSIKNLISALKKQPDGLVWRKDKAGKLIFEWVEVENAAKPKVEVFRLLRVAEYRGQIVDSEKNASLGQLTVVFDGTLNHANRMLRAADELWRNQPRERRIQLENSVRLVSADLRSALIWVAHSSMTLHEYRHRLK